MNIFTVNLLLMIAGVINFSCTDSKPDVPYEVNRAQPQKPLMKDFIGLNGHFKFKPELYNQVTNLVRNYHPLSWDVKKPGDAITLPACVNGVNWEEHVYGRWIKYGFEVDICVQFGSFGRNNSNYTDLWDGQDQWEYDYGFQMAKYFGPSGGKKLGTSIEIGNEPGVKFNNTLYKKIFTNMAKGIRAGDSEMKIVTCTVHATKPDDYTKNLDDTFGSPDMISLFDVINVHDYAFKEEEDRDGRWDRSYPEDPKINFLKNIDHVINWRNKNADNKEIWITEFGWDAVTDDMMDKREDWFKKLNWTDVTDLQQAQYLVRSFLIFSEMDVQRAYMYYYDDSNKPKVHGASGLTRNFEPKKSFWAVKHLYETLGEYRFSKIIQQQSESVFIYEYVHGQDETMKIWVVWSPTGSNIKNMATLRELPGNIVQSSIMPVEDSIIEEAKWEQIGSDSIEIEVTETPVYLVFAKKQ